MNCFGDYVVEPSTKASTCLSVLWFMELSVRYKEVKSDAKSRILANSLTGKVVLAR